MGRCWLTAAVRSSCFGRGLFMGSLLWEQTRFGGAGRIFLHARFFSYLLMVYNRLVCNSRY